jgi:hypothetical protein
MLLVMLYVWRIKKFITTLSYEAYLVDAGSKYHMRSVTIYQATRCHVGEDKCLHYLHQVLEKYLELPVNISPLHPNYTRKEAQS